MSTNTRKGLIQEGLDGACADPEGGGAGGPEPLWKITSNMGFYGEKAIGPPPPFLEIVGPPLENVGPPSGTLVNNSFL